MFMTKTLSNLGVEGNFLNLIKSKKRRKKTTTGSMQINGETLESFTLRS